MVNEKNIVVRKASLDDVKGIVEIYCSGIDKWYRFIDDQAVQSNYEELSLAEKWAHGGPWMSVETLSIHLNYVLINGQIPLVALYGGKIVGELELYIGYEPNVLGKHGFIDVLEVHRNYRGMGVGRKLVEESFQITVRNECDIIAVWPDPGVVGFYRKMGFNNIAYSVSYVELDLTKTNPINPSDLDTHSFPEKYDQLSNWLFVSLRVSTSSVAWLKIRWRYIVEMDRLKKLEQSIDNACALIITGTWRSRDESTAYLWVRDEDSIPLCFENLVGLAKYLGFSRLVCTVAKEIYVKYIERSYKTRLISEYVLLYRNL